MGGSSSSDSPTRFVPREELFIVDLDDAVRQMMDPASPYHEMGALLIMRRQLEQELRADRRHAAVLMQHDGQVRLVPPELQASHLDDLEWVQGAEPLLMNEPLPVVSVGAPSIQPSVVVDDNGSIAGAWLPTDGVDEPHAVAIRPPDDFAYEHEEDVEVDESLGDEADGDANRSGLEQTATGWYASPHRAEDPWTGEAKVREAQVREQLAAHDQLRHALERERELRDDVEAVELLSAAGRRALGSVESLLDNDDLWTKLTSAHREPLTSAEARQLERFNDAGLRGLLTGLGYREPPPVAELVDDTLISLALAHGSAVDVRRHERQVEAARRDLSTFAIRLRRLVSTSETQLPPSLARRVLRVADREGDAVMTAVAPVVLEAVGNLLFPGGGVAIKIGAAVGGVVSARVLALRPRQGSPTAAPVGGGDAQEDLGLAFRALAEVTDEGDRHFESHQEVDEVIARLWIIDEAIRLALQSEWDHESTYTLDRALKHLRAARHAAMAGQPISYDVQRASEHIARVFGA